MRTSRLSLRESLLRAWFTAEAALDLQTNPATVRLARLIQAAVNNACTTLRNHTMAASW